MREPTFKLGLNFTDSDGVTGVLSCESTLNMIGQNWETMKSQVEALKNKD